MIWLLLAAAPLCAPVAADATVRVSFKAGSTVDDVLQLATAKLCAAPSVADRTRPLKLAIDGTVKGAQLPALVSLLLEVPVEPPPPSAPTCDPRLVAAIVPVDPWTRKVPGALRDTVTECAQHQVRIVPAFKGGVSRGFKLFAVRQGSVIEALGFANGDTVLSINGLLLASPDQALEAYTRARGAKELKFAIERSGEPRTITWLVQ